MTLQLPPSRNIHALLAIAITLLCSIAIIVISTVAPTPLPFGWLLAYVLFLLAGIVSTVLAFIWAFERRS